jgi:hypothetical protein
MKNAGHEPGIYNSADSQFRRNVMAANPRPDPNERLVRVFDAEQESEAMVVSGLLDSYGIDSEITALDVPQDVIPIGGTVILVREEDAKRAREIIDEYRRNPNIEAEGETSAADGDTTQ